MLEPDDVLEDESVDDDVFGHQRPQDLVYPVEMAKLARLRVFLTTSYSLKECLLMCGSADGCLNAVPPPPETRSRD